MWGWVGTLDSDDLKDLQSFFLGRQLISWLTLIIFVTLPETNSSPLKIGHRIPTIHFQV